MKQRENYLFVVSLVCIGLVLEQSEARRSWRQGRCQAEECLLSKQHFTLYSNIKRAIETKFDMKGKQMYPLLNSIETLRYRFAFDNTSREAKLVKGLLSNEYLVKSLRVIESPQGRTLIDLYRSPMNNHEQSLSCSTLRIQDIKTASKLLDVDRELESVFGKIHKNFAKKSAKKCLKRSCTSLDIAMSRVDYMLKGHRHDRPRPSSDSESYLDNLILDNSTLTATTISIPKENQIDQNLHREFGPQELELCKFFKKTNETSCSITGRELKEIKLIGTVPSDMIDVYIKNKNVNGTESKPQNSALSSSQVVSELCRPIQGLLDYNLAALKWYSRANLIDKEKLESKADRCPRLLYWLEIDRLCSELEKTMNQSSPRK